MSNTVSESYIEGFCKVAEAAGVDPEALVKMAGPSPLFSSTGVVLKPRKLKRAAKRFLELLTGSRAGDYATRSWHFAMNGVTKGAPRPKGLLGSEKIDRASKRSLELHRMAQDEWRKVLKARAITGVAGGLGLAGALSAYGLSGGGSNSNHTADGE